MKRKLYIIGEISYKNFGSFTEELSALEDESSEAITIELTSEGGDAYVSLAYVARIRKSPCFIKVVGNGYVASAAVLILACGDRRAMTEESWLMVHEENGGVDGNTSLIEIETKQMRRLEDQADRALAHYSRVDAKTWAKLHKETTYLTANECLAMGVIDEVI